MDKNRVVGIKRDRYLTPAEGARLAKLRAAIDAEKPEIIRHALARRAQRGLDRIMVELKTERERLGLTLDELGDKTGISKSALSRLENDREANPTIKTLVRYAKALGKSIDVRLIQTPRRKAV
jgi:DNA-binding XRE family transcriptional regulator